MIYHQKQDKEHFDLSGPDVVTDFYRNVYCILGLPFDALSENESHLKVVEAVKSQRRCFFSTPNLNFLINSIKDPEFRYSVLRSDLSLADGMPIIWIARLLGLPLSARVAGSSLFETLRKSSAVPIKIFFFGGPDGVAHRAADVINQSEGKMICVGACYPGYGEIEELSSEAIIEQINNSEPDFLVVSLGAKRGQAWIERNLQRLHAPVLSHLGAVVNFTAGTVARAPGWLGSAGFEWLWRIKEEPSLFMRYFRDGKGLIEILYQCVLPLYFHNLRLSQRRSAPTASELVVHSKKDHCVIALNGPWYEGNLQPLREAFANNTIHPVDIILEFNNVTAFDSACIGLLLILLGHQSKVNRRLVLSQVPDVLVKTFKLHRVDYLIAQSAQTGAASRTTQPRKEYRRP